MLYYTIHQPSASRRHLRLGLGRGGRLPSRAGLSGGGASYAAAPTPGMYAVAG